MKTENMETTVLKRNSRIESIDALRGFALLGIIIANIPFTQNHSLINGTDSILNFLFYFLIDKKFITLFSILFGFGFYIQMNRAKEKNYNFNKYFIYRMLLLYLIGTIHAFGIWNGDILRAYALGGILLLAIKNWSTKRILIYAGIFIIILTGIFYIGSTLADWRVYNYDYALANELPVTNSFFRYLKINAIMDPWVNFSKDLPITLAFTFGNMLLGFVLAKTNFLSLPEKFSNLTLILLTLGITVGFSCNYIYYKISTGAIEMEVSLIWLPFVTIGGIVLQSLFYIIVFLKLYQIKISRNILNVFVAVGQTSLSNYILQSIFYITVFYHCTNLFQLFGKLSQSQTWLMAICFFAMQVIISKIWLIKHNQGPIEFIWKKLSYKQANKLHNSKIAHTNNNNESK